MKARVAIWLGVCGLMMLALGALPGMAWAAAGWASGGTMHDARVSAIAAPLSSGRVLVAGGFNDRDGDLARAEIYHPDDHIWVPADPMSVARSGAVAAPLSGSRVLVAGGRSGAEGPQASAEIYDFKTRAWTPTGAMGVARAEATAAPLPDGRVLVAGGFNNVDGTLASAEIYDPGTGTWTPTSPMWAARGTATATPLPEGWVLVAGGYSEVGGFLASAEIYDPVAGVWTRAGAMSVGRVRATATALPDGGVLVAGGQDGPASMSGTAEVYQASNEPSTGSWSAAGTPEAAEYAVAAPLPGGGVLLAGGFNGSSYLHRAEAYDHASRTWTSVGPMSTARAEATATALADGRVLVAAGHNSIAGYLDSTEVFTPATSVSAPDLNLGPAIVGDAAERSVTITNTGAARLFVTGVTIAGADADDFEIVTDGCSAAPVAAGAACEIGIRFTPDALGDRGATLTLADNAGSGSQSIALRGTGAAQSVSIDPTMTFDPLLVGQQSPTAFVQVANTGDAPLQVTATAITGPDAPDFAIPAAGDECTAEPTPGGSACRIALRLTPSAAGPRTATLTITITDEIGTGSHQVALHGTGFPWGAPSDPTTPVGPGGAGGPVGPPQVPAGGPGASDSPGGGGPADPTDEADHGAPSGAGHDRPSGRVRVDIASRTARKGRVRLRLRCVRGDRCQGRLRLSIRRVRGRGSFVAAGHRRYSVAHGRHAISVRLNRRARRQLRRHGRLRVTATATLAGERGTPRDTRTVHLPRRQHRRGS